MERGRVRRRRGESLLLLPFIISVPLASLISFRLFMSHLRVPRCPRLVSSRLVLPCTPCPIPPHPPPHPTLPPSPSPRHRRATISGAVPPANSGGGHIASAAKWAPSSTLGLYNRVVANGERAVPQCLSLLFFPLLSSLTRGRLRCAVSKHRQLK